MRRLTILFAPLLLAAGLSAAPPTPPRNSGADWPTLHGDLQRSGFYPHFPKPPFRLSWRKELYRELTGTRSEVIVGGGLAFMGTYAGKMYAWDARTGEQRWTFSTGGAIGHSPTFSDGTLYFGSLDRKLYAVNAADGKPRRRFTAGEGFYTSPVAWRGKVLAGARDGVFYALDARTGKPAWKVQTGDRILTPASISEDGERVVWASEDMRVYCAEVQTGRLAWKSPKLHGLSLRDHAPVIFRGLVMVATNPVRDFHTVMGQNQQMLVGRTGFKGKDDRYIPGTADDVRREQDAIVQHLREHPEEQVFHAFRIQDGKEPWVAPILYTGGFHNPFTPPCCNPQTGDVFVLIRSAYTVWDGGGEIRPYTGVGKLDLSTGRVALIEHAYKSREPGRPPGRKDMPFQCFNTIGDETQTLSCSPDYLFSNHQGFLGALDLRSGLCASMWGKRDTYAGYYGPGTFGWENQGGYEKARAAGQPYGLVNEWHGPDKAIVSVAGNRVYYPSGSQVLCLEGAE